MIPTQNIDGLEGLAGVPRAKIVQAHGAFDGAHCIATGAPVPVAELREAVFARDMKEATAALGEKHGGLV